MSSNVSEWVTWLATISTRKKAVVKNRTRYNWTGCSLLNHSFTAMTLQQNHASERSYFVVQHITHTDIYICIYMQKTTMVPSAERLVTVVFFYSNLFFFLLFSSHHNKMKFRINLKVSSKKFALLIWNSFFLIKYKLRMNNWRMNC